MKEPLLSPSLVLLQRLSKFFRGFVYFSNMAFSYSCPSLMFTCIEVDRFSDATLKKRQEKVGVFPTWLTPPPPHPRFGNPISLSFFLLLFLVNFLKS